MALATNRRLFVYECQAQGRFTGEPACPTLVAVWPEPPCTYYFFERSEDELMEAWVRMQPGLELRGRYEIDYDQWQDVSSVDLQVGGFLIPCRHRTQGFPRAPGFRTLEIDPGLVFGSGLHPTTKGCLLALEVLFRRHRIETVLDFGTGTGILAVACALLGARKIVAVDCNPLAVRVACRNFAANGVSSVVHPVVAEDPGVIRPSLDLILMNIEWPCLVRAVSQPHWRRHALAVLSGFLENAWSHLSSILPASHTPIHEESHDGWLTVVLEAGADP